MSLTANVPKPMNHRSVRVFLDHGEAYGNLGDDAMLMAAQRRIAEALEGRVSFVVPRREAEPLPDLAQTQFVPSARLAIPEAVDRLGTHRWAALLGSLRQPYLLERWIARRESLLSGSPAWQAMTDALARCDALYAVGCGNMNDIAPHVTLLYRLALCRAAKRRGIPVITSSQGLGPLRQRWSRIVAEHICALSEQFTLRAPFAAGQAVAQCRRVARAPVVGDEAYSLATASEERWARLLRRNRLVPGTPYLVIHYRSAGYVGGVDTALEVLAEALSRIPFAGSYVFAPMSLGGHSLEDAAVGRRLQSMLGRDRPFVTLVGLEDPLLAKALVWGASGVVALSYHLQVFALSGAIPFVILTQGPYYRAKADGMQRLAGGTTPVLELPGTDPGQAAHRLGRWLRDRAGQIAELRHSQRRIESVNTLPVQGLMRCLNLYDNARNSM